MNTASEWDQQNGLNLIVAPTEKSVHDIYYIIFFSYCCVIPYGIIRRPNIFDRFFSYNHNKCILYFVDRLSHSEHISISILYNSIQFTLHFRKKKQSKQSFYWSINVKRQIKTGENEYISRRPSRKVYFKLKGSTPKCIIYLRSPTAIINLRPIRCL